MFTAANASAAERAACPQGGEEIESGLDDGAGGGIANDGVLEAGEVTSTSFVCNGSGLNVGSTDAPGGAPGSSTIITLGGASDAGPGGDGGAVTVEMNNGTLGGHVKLFNTGAADPSFSFPAAPAPYLGTSPAIVTSDATVLTSQPDGGAASGTLFLDENGYLNIVNSDGSTSQVTGLSIGSGVTVTVGVSDSFGAYIPLTVNGPCLNSGTILADNQGETAEISIFCSSYFGDSGSSILNNGPDGQGVSSGGISLSAGVIWNQGTLQANGGDGASGGSGGSIYIYTNGVTTLFNTGGLYSIGGAGSVGAGGNGGGIFISGAGNVDNSGPLDTSGGDGAVSGGSGGNITIQAGADAVRSSVIGANGRVRADLQTALAGFVAGGSLRNAGALTSLGGSVDASCAPQPSVEVCPQGPATSVQPCYYTAAVTCAGGAGGQPSLQATGGALINNAAISGGGGSSVNGPGGNGGAINLGVSGGVAPVAPGDLLLSGSLDVSGGAGATGGGNGGAINVSLDPGALPNGQEIILYGYDHLDSSGGAGAAGGGPAGAITLGNTNYSVVSSGCGDYCDESASVNGPGGSVVNGVALYARGGSGGAGTGGNGGPVTLTTQSQYAFSGDSFEQVINAGAIDASGGGGASGGSAGWVSLYGLTGLDNTGALTVRGGAGTSGAGGAGAALQLASGAGEASNLGALDASGGAGVASGGAAGQISLAAPGCDDSGQLVAAGGAAGAGGSGGAGGQVSLWSSSAPSVITAGAPGGISVAGGAAPGGLAGQAGQVLVDGWDATNQWTY